MKTYAKYIFTPLLGLLLLAPASFAQDAPPDSQPQAYTQAELDQILAPIALYPDSLLSQILMASTYPLEVVEAARWSRANPGFEGEAAVRMVEDRDWDHSVKSLVAFPKVLEMMDEKLDWTQSLGNAYLSLPEQVTETVQNLRQKADAAGNLKSNKHYRVEQRDGNISVEPQNPEVVYVPYYDPLVVYGSWWWPAYPPVYWAPWPGYYAYPGLSGFYWSLGIFIGPRFFFGGFDWHHRHITSVNRAHFNNFRHVRHAPNPSRHAWKHDPRHRRGVGFRRPFTKNQFARTFREAGPKFHGNFPRRQSSARAPRFESRDGSRFQSRFEQGKRSFSDSRKFESRSDNRRGPTRADRNSPAPNSEFQRDRRRMPMVQNRSGGSAVKNSNSDSDSRKFESRSDDRRGPTRAERNSPAPNSEFQRDRRRMPMVQNRSGGSAVKNSNSDRNFERRSNARRGGAWSDNMRGSIRSNGFSNRGRTPGVKNAPVSSFSSKKSVQSRSFKRGDFSARRGSPGIKGKQGTSFSSKKSFNWKDSGGSRSFGNFRRGNGGGGNKFRSR